MSEPVRLILDGHLRGAENMRRDLQLLEEGAPTVRLYGWRPACASLGRSQGPEAVDREAARSMGVDVVDRPTGGGAILHNEAEVTYSVVVPLDFPGHPGDIPGSFMFCSLGVLRALRTLGLDAEFQSGEGGRDDLCYLRRQGTHVMVDGRKVSGGAQRRTRSHVLQHGTVIVERDAERMARLFRADVDAVRAGVTSLHEEGVRVSRRKLVELLVEGYGDAWGVEFREASFPADPTTQL